MGRKISLFSLVLLIVSAIDSIRTLPTAALFGPHLIFFFILAALFFLIPVAFISAELSSRYSEEGGIYCWIKESFGKRSAVCSVWLQWINTMVWYPTMLLFIAGTAAHFIDSSLAQNKWFLLPFSLCIFWGLTLVNLKGVQVSARFSSFCGLIGTLLPMALLICLGVGWVMFQKPVAISFDSFIPTFDLKNSGVALVSIMASFLGMELAGVHVSDIQNPQKNFPKAIGTSVLILLATLILGSLSIAVVTPKDEIQYIDGVMQTFRSFFLSFQIPFCTPILAFFIVLGSVGGSVNWLLAPAKGLLQAAEDGFLPSYFLRKNKHGTSVRILITQALIVSCFSFCLELIPSINAFYWFFMALSTGLYMGMYILLFWAAFRLKRSSQGFQIPKGLRTVSCFCGILGCLTTLFVGFLPPPDVEVNRFFYAIWIGTGLILLTFPLFGLFAYQRRGLSLKRESV